MFTHIIILTIAAGMTISAPTPHADPNPAPAADPAPKPGFTPVVYTSPLALSYNAFSSVQAHPSASLALVKSAPTAVLPSVGGLGALPAVYTLQAQAAPAVGYAVNYPYVVV